jgi:porin
MPRLISRLGANLILALTTAVALASGTESSSNSAAAQPPTNAQPSHFLLRDSLGHVIRVSTNDVQPSLHPPATTGLERQIPPSVKGAPQSQHVRQRIAESKLGQESLQWLPATPPLLAPYLGNLDELGNTAIQPGALFTAEPLSQAAQAGKYWLSGFGFRESFVQSLTFVSMSDTLSGASTLQYYAADFLGKWAVYEVPGGGPAGWLSVEANVQLGLSPASRTQSPQGNLGTVVNPQANVFGPNGLWMSELAWQQSFLDGRLVMLAGLVDQANYLDANAYANNSQGQFLNGAFVNSSVLPLPSNNLGLNLQWQPSHSWYVLLGTGANNQAPGQSPFENLSLNDWSYLLEAGLTPKNVLGLGPGVYRLQPFLATVGGQTQAGVGLNVQQQLGQNSPLAWFGRFGVGGSHVALGGAQAQASTGVVMAAPLQYAGLVPKLSNDLLGIGFVWSQPSATTRAGYHQDEYVLEAFYALQLRPMVKIQPDVQYIWDPAFNPAKSTLVCQLQLVLTW